VKVESTDVSKGRLARDQLRVDAMAISYRSDIGPYAQGDLIVSFIDLLKDCTVPIVLYRPATVVTDLGLYGSAHVGNLGGIIKPTNLEKILRLDLLKTDYSHGLRIRRFCIIIPIPCPIRWNSILVRTEGRIRRRQQGVCAAQCQRHGANHHFTGHRESGGPGPGERKTHPRWNSRPYRRGHSGLQQLTPPSHG